MAAPQTGIFAPGTASHAYLELDARHGADSGELIQERLDAMLESMVGAAQAPSTD